MKFIWLNTDYVLADWPIGVLAARDDEYSQHANAPNSNAPSQHILKMSE